MRHMAPVLAVLPALLCSPSQAGVHWRCGLSDDTTQLVCQADDEAAAPRSRPEGGREAGPAAAVVNGTRFPLDPRRSYTVDFWSPATDLAHVEQLARATMCYRTRDCQVSFSAAPLPGSAVRTARRGD
jgi:hypothetical protein